MQSQKGEYNDCIFNEPYRRFTQKRWNKNTHAVKRREWFIRQFTKTLERQLKSFDILPHYQDTKDDILDGQLLFEDITYPDSYGREFYALEDGSYFMIENKAATLFGAAYLIKDGNIKQICEKDKSICMA